MKNIETEWSPRGTSPKITDYIKRMTVNRNANGEMERQKKSERLQTAASTTASMTMLRKFFVLWRKWMAPLIKIGKPRSRRSLESWPKAACLLVVVNHFWQPANNPSRVPRFHADNGRNWQEFRFSRGNVVIKMNLQKHWSSLWNSANKASCYFMEDGSTCYRRYDRERPKEKSLLQKFVHSISSDRNGARRENAEKKSKQWSPCNCYKHQRIVP